MSLSLRSAAGLAVLALTSPALYSQSVISAKSGVVHLAQGDVYLGGQKIEPHFAVFPDVKEKMELRTEEGRAEVLLTPGIFLRVGESSAIRMISNRLIDTRVEFLSGVAMVESDITYKDNKDTHVAMIFGDYTVTIARHGLFELQSSPAQVKVFSGEITVAHAGETVTLKEGHLLPLTGAMVSEKFDAKEGGELYRWSQARSQSMSVANLSAAKTAADSGYVIPAGGSWFYNRYYGLYTFLPGSGSFISPFGNTFYSPYTVYAGFYEPVTYYYSNYGNSNGGSRGGLNNQTINARSTTLSSVNASSPVRTQSVAGNTVAAPAPVAGGVSLGSGHAGGHGR